MVVSRCTQVKAHLALLLVSVAVGCSSGDKTKDTGGCDTDFKCTEGQTCWYTQCIDAKGLGAGVCIGGVGTTCATTTDCCQESDKGNVCIGPPLDVCAAICYSSAECECCVQMQGAEYGVCMAASAGQPCM